MFHGKKVRHEGILDVQGNVIGHGTALKMLLLTICDVEI
jgi:hypothetical protein